jgi:hypothetical protein
MNRFQLRLLAAATACAPSVAEVPVAHHAVLTTPVPAETDAESPPADEPDDAPIAQTDDPDIHIS